MEISQGFRFNILNGKKIDGVPKTLCSFLNLFFVFSWFKIYINFFYMILLLVSRPKSD